MEWTRNLARGAFDAVLSLRYNWGIGILSVALAVALWVFVTDREDPDRTAFVLGTVPIEAINVPPDQAVLSISESGVRVRARAPESVFDNLTTEDFRATVDLSDAVGEQITATVMVESLERRADVVDFTPTEVRVTLEPVIQRSVPVGVREVGGLPRGFRLGEVVVDVSEAVVTGPERLVNQVVVAEADVNLAGADADFEQRVPLQARDGQGGDVQGVSVEPEAAVVQVAVEQLEFSAAYIVQPNVTGTPAVGYNVTAISVTPAFVTISGPADLFAALDPIAGILTDAVSIDGATTDVVRTVALQLPAGATVAAPGPGVTVTVTIEPAVGTFGFSVALQLTNLEGGLVATPSQSTLQVILSGAATDLRSMTATDVRATIDLADLDAGEHTVPVLLNIPTFASVVSVTPAEITVTIREE